MRIGLICLAAFALGSGSALGAQQRPGQEPDLPRWVEGDVISFFNDPSTIHFSGRTRIPSTRIVTGDVASLGGPFTIAGEVDGDLIVVNGDLVLEAGGSVTGNVLVVGGRILGEELGTFGGNVRVFEEPLRYVQEGDRISAAGEPEERGFGPDLAWGDVRLVVKAGQNYNRTEGLPVMFGPSVRTKSTNPSRLDLFGIWRTEMGLDLDKEDFGYAFRGEQSIGGRGRIVLGATAFSMVSPIEDWGLSNLEASLSTFILHKDYRDYFERAGWSAYIRFRFQFMPVELKTEYVQEDPEFSRVEGPWSLTKNNEAWRNQPLVAEGDLKYLEGTLSVDTRNHPDEPSDGWLLTARLRRGVGGDLTRPAFLESPEDPPVQVGERVYDTDFLSGFLDVRSYNRINPGLSLNLRGVLGGALTDTPLPPQFQHALGGPGSLPGFPLFDQAFHSSYNRRGVHAVFFLKGEGDVLVQQVLVEAPGGDGQGAGFLGAGRP